ncbi:MAG: hypothetical protein ACRD1W_13775 [Vicinamibacterales bacterium]
MSRQSTRHAITGLKWCAQSTCATAIEGGNGSKTMEPLRVTGA